MVSVAAVRARPCLRLHDASAMPSSESRLPRSRHAIGRRRPYPTEATGAVARNACRHDRTSPTRTELPIGHSQNELGIGHHAWRQRVPLHDSGGIGLNPVEDDKASSLYELRIADPSETEQSKALLKTVALNLLSMSAGHMEAPVPARIDVQIVDRRNGRVLFNRRTDPADAHRLAEQITDHLDRLDVSAFRTEWGLAVDAARPTPSPVDDSGWYQRNGAWYCSAHETRYCKICSGS